MALLMLEGFDDNVFEDRGTWDISSPPRTSTTYGRYDKGAQAGTSAGTIRYILQSVPTATVTFGFAFKSQILTANEAFFRFEDSTGASICKLHRRATNALYLTGPFGTSADTSTGLLPDATWTYIELQVKVDNASGSYELRVNGVNELSASTVDTQPGTNAYISFARFAHAFDGSFLGAGYYDDAYLLDDSTSFNNDFLGDSRVETKFPNGNGNTSNMTGSDADKVDNYLLVNESTASSTAYVGSPSLGDFDTYAMEGFATTGFTIHGIQTTVWAAKSEVGTKFMRPVVRTGTTGGAQSDNVGTSVVLTTDYLPYDETWSINPDTSTSWTYGEIDVVEIGQETRSS